MVLPLEELPLELRASIAGCCEAAAAGRMAQSNQAWRGLLRERLVVLQRQREEDAAALELQQAFTATVDSAALLEMNDVGGGQLAIRVAARGAQLRAWTTMFSCECCGLGSRPCGSGFTNVQRHLASKTHWTAHRLRVHNLPFDNAAWHAFVVRSLEPALAPLGP